MTIEYQDTNGQPNGQTEPASEPKNGPTSAPRNVTNNNIDITNPFNNAVNRNNEEPSPASGSQPNSEPKVTFEDIVSKKQFMGAQT